MVQTAAAEAVTTASQTVETDDGEGRGRAAYVSAGDSSLTADETAMDRGYLR